MWFLKGALLFIFVVGICLFLAGMLSNDNKATTIGAIASIGVAIWFSIRDKNLKM